MKKLITILTVILFLSFLGAQAQTSNSTPRKRVAVYTTGDENVSDAYKKVINSKFISAFANNSNYIAIERNEDFINEVKKEMDKQLSGEVRDNQIAKIGQNLGAKYVIVVDVTEFPDEMFIAARMIDVESAGIVAACDDVGVVEGVQQVRNLAEKVAKQLIAEKRVESASTKTSKSSNVVSNGNKKTYTVNGVSFDMVFVPGGSYMMGGSDPEAWGNEKPVHSETVRDFWIGKTEVTQQLWQAVMGNNPSKSRGGSLPVDNVSFYDVQRFIERLNELTGAHFRLPTEAEWEYAARGGRNSKNYKYSGSNDIYYVAWFWDNSGNTTHPVGTKAPNELGIYDMSGNVWEWTSDLSSKDYNSYRNGGDTGKYRVMRGGCNVNYADGCRVSHRSWTSPEASSSGWGFRLAAQ